VLNGPLIGGHAQGGSSEMVMQFGQEIAGIGPRVKDLAQL
jgi:hypothetical protein